MDYKKYHKFEDDFTKLKDKLHKDLKYIEGLYYQQQFEKHNLNR